MSVVQFPEMRPQGADALFAIYRNLAIKAQRTLRKEDAMEAGRAWAEFLREFEK